MTKATPGVSVIVPAYNAAAFIAQALESLIAQSVPNWEAIVIDDGSADDTISVASNFAERDSRIRVLSQSHQGVSAARNMGIREAQFDWLLFLDADDWVLPEFLERMTKLAADDPDLDAAYCGYARAYPDGSQLAAGYLPASREMFPILARYCAYPIHTCIVRRSRVQSLGGFDASLVTCEDWDLWQRIARSGARYSSLHEVLACYRIRPTSASMGSLQMLKDGLRVMQRGHSADPRVRDAHPDWAGGMPIEFLARTQLHFTCWTAGLAIGSGQAAQFLLNELPDAQDPGLDPQIIAGMLFLSVLLPDCWKQTDWPSLWPTYQPRIRGFLQALEQQSLTPGLTRRVILALERMILDAIAFSEPVTLELTSGIKVEITSPIQDLAFSTQVERAYCRIELEGKILGAIEVPVFDGMVSKYVLADAIAAEYAWIILGRFFDHTLYQDLTLPAMPTGLSVLRGNIVLAEGLPQEEGANWDWLHDQIGWLVFIQEIWSRPNWENRNFYDSSAVRERAVVRQLDQDVLWVEITDELPDIKTRANALQVMYTIGGAVIGSIKIPIQGNLLRASQLRVAINNAAGFELCRAAVREGLLGRPISGAGSLRSRLAEAAATKYHPPEGKLFSAADLSAKILSEVEAELTDGSGSLLIGRRVPGIPGTSHSRRAVLPQAAASELIEAARTAGEIVLQLPADKQVPDQVLYAPELISSPDENLAEVASIKTAAKDPGPDQDYRRDHFETIFAASDDPWKYTSDYERVKYEHTLGLLPNQLYPRALELGCAEGHFTAMLAPQVGDLLAADISEIALQRASERCAGFSNIRYMQLDITKDPLPGPFDLIVCSEMLYYVGDRQALKAVIQKIASALKPGGYFLTAHAHLLVDEPDRPGFDWKLSFGARAISDSIQNNWSFSLKKEIRTPLYRAQLYQRGPSLSIAKFLHRPQITQLEKQPTSLLPEVASHVRWHGTAARSNFQAQPVTTKRLPILMYHRIAPTGAPGLAAYRVTPAAFHDQLRYLSDAGYYSISLEEWRAARELRKPIPGKPVIITFDDGYVDFKDVAWPLLKRYGFSATVSLVSNAIGRTNHWNEYYGDVLPLLDWPDILLLQKEGIEFGSHSANHPHLTGISLSEIVKEACMSRKVLQEKLGKPIHSFAYPYGSSDRVVEHLVGACGYVYGLTITPRRCEFNDPLLALPRIEISGSDDLQKFIQKLQP